jgi:hypothetical protein
VKSRWLGLLDQLYSGAQVPGAASTVTRAIIPWTPRARSVSSIGGAGEARATAVNAEAESAERRVHDEAESTMGKIHEALPIWLIFVP